MGTRVDTGVSSSIIEYHRVSTLFQTRLRVCVCMCARDRAKLRSLPHACFNTNLNIIEVVEVKAGGLWWWLVRKRLACQRAGSVCRSWGRLSTVRPPVRAGKMAHAGPEPYAYGDTSRHIEQNGSRRKAVRAGGLVEQPAVLMLGKYDRSSVLLASAGSLHVLCIALSRIPDAQGRGRIPFWPP